MEYILQTNQVSKTIGGKSLVSNIDLHVKKGEIYGFLGLKNLAAHSRDFSRELAASLN